MSDFNVRSDSVNVEQIMEQIRARIREKRGVDYTEQQIRELAAVKLEKFLDPRGVRSDLLDHFKAQPAYEPPELPNFAFEDATLFESNRAPIRWIRKLLMPILKLFFNPNPLIQALHIQSRLNAMTPEREARRERSRRAMDQLYYELVHNLVVETTRTGIEVKNLTMRVESISSRLEFNERRARALEGVVVYKPAEVDEPPAPRPAPQVQRQSAPVGQPQQRYAPSQPSSRAPAQVPSPAPAAATTPAAGQGQPSVGGQGQGHGLGAPGEGPGQRSRRRRRRRGRRSGAAASAIMGAPGVAAPGTTAEAPGLADASDQLDAMDRIEDGGPPESEEGRAAAAEQVEQAAGAESHQPEARVDEPEPRVAQPDPPDVEAAPATSANIAPAVSAEPASAAPVAHAAPASAPPSTLDHADPDPQ